jgi:DNA-binding MarR family transcriptional regulator
MPFDALITNPGRLRILTALASEPIQEFVQLRGATQMTDGNLATHARRLHSAGLVEIDKRFRDGKPVTTFTLTSQGRGALQAHVENVMRALRPRSAASPLMGTAKPFQERNFQNYDLIER